MAGFDHSRPCFYLPRASITPVEELRRLIFPEVEVWEQRVASGLVQQTSISMVAFFNLLKHLRIVLLQDSVLLKQKFPDFFLWSHSIFSNPMFVEFETQLSAQVSRETNPLELRIQQALPELYDRLDLQQRVSSDRMTLVESKLGQVEQAILGFTGVCRSLAAGITNAASSIGGIPGSQTLNRSGESSVASTILQPSIISQAQTTATVPLAAGSNVQSSDTYTMSRNITTVSDVYREWMHGIGDGPAVKDLEERLGTSWRKTPKDSRHYLRRKAIIDEMDRRVAARPGTNHVTIGAEMDAELQSRRISLAKLQDEIAAANRAREAPNLGP
jgi:hypothetical protein